MSQPVKEKKRSNSLLESAGTFGGWDTSLIPADEIEIDTSNPFEIGQQNKSRDEIPIESSNNKQNKKNKKKRKSKSKNIKNTNNNNNNNEQKQSETIDFDPFNMNDDDNKQNNNKNVANNNVNNNNNDDNPFKDDFFDVLGIDNDKNININTNNIKQKNNNNKNINNNNNNHASAFYDFDTIDNNNNNDNNNNVNNNNNNNNNNNVDFYDFGFVEKQKNDKSKKNNNKDYTDDDGDSSVSELSDNEFKQQSNKFHKNDDVNNLNPPNIKKKKSNKKRHSAPVTSLANQGAKLKTNKDREFGVNIKSIDANKRVKAELNKNKNNIKNDKKLNKNNNNNNNNKKEKYDVLPELRRGTALLKYGRRGYPHFRQFNLADDNERIIWFSSKKNENKSSIFVKTIDEVITGQHTKEFERIGWVTLKPASFSIIYNKRKDSLNLVAKSVDEMRMWVESLRLLSNLAKKGENLRKMKKLEVAVDFRDRNRPQSRNHSGNFLRSHETKEHQVDPALYKKLMTDLESLKKLYREVERDARSEIVQSTPEWKSIEQILSEMEERIEELEHEVKNTRNTKIAENDVWRTRIDLESLQEKIKVLNKRYKKNNNNNSKRRWSVFNT